MTKVFVIPLAVAWLALLLLAAWERQIPALITIGGVVLAGVAVWLAFRRDSNR